MVQEIYLVDARRLYTRPVEAEFDPDRPDWVAVPYDGRLKQPPAVGPNQIQRSLGDAADSDWEVIPDWRGHRYWLSDGSEHVITTEGISPPEGALAAKPPPTLTELKALKSSELDRACAEQILAGFTSMALGAAFHYPSNLTDQANLTASVLDALVNASDSGWHTPFWCVQEGLDTWSWRSHTGPQIIQVGQDGKAAILATQGKNQTLQAALAAASDADQVAAITW